MSRIDTAQFEHLTDGVKHMVWGRMVDLGLPQDVEWLEITRRVRPVNVIREPSKTFSLKSAKYGRGYIYMGECMRYCVLHIQDGKVMVLHEQDDMPDELLNPSTLPHGEYCPMLEDESQDCWGGNIVERTGDSEPCPIHSSGRD